MTATTGYIFIVRNNNVMYADKCCVCDMWKYRRKMDIYKFTLVWFHCKSPSHWSSTPFTDLFTPWWAIDLSFFSPPILSVYFTGILFGQFYRWAVGTGFFYDYFIYFCAGYFFIGGLGLFYIFWSGFFFSLSPISFFKFLNSSKNIFSKLILFSP